MQKLNNEFLEKKICKNDDFNYKQSELSAGIIHIGVGNFHRAHQGYFLDALFNKRKDFNFGIIGAGLRDNDKVMRDDLKSQDYLTTIILRDENNSKSKIIQSMIGFLDIDNEILINELIKDNIKIVSLTITEGGYFINANGKFDILNEKIQEDINNFNNPKTVFGVLLLALKKRLELRMKPFTILSCDNISNNGNIVNNILLNMSKLIDNTLYKYISNEVSCPNSMVDRITPALCSKNKKYILDNYGYIDKRPIFCEPYIQWILEDNFCNVRPRLEEVGVLFVKDILPYELMKIRILNGSHACISSLAAILNITYVHDALENSIVSEFLDKIMKNEVIPSLDIKIDINLYEYYENVKRRFSNKYIEDTITRICMDNSNKQPKFIVNSIQDTLSRNSNVDGLALVCALWCRYCTGIDENNIPLEINDTREELLTEQALKAKNKPSEFLKITDVFGNLEQNSIFVESFSKSLNSIYKNGVKNTVKKFNNK